MSLYLNDIMDMMKAKKIEIKKRKILFISVKRKISGIHPITDERNIFFSFVGRFKSKLVPIKRQ